MDWHLQQPNSNTKYGVLSERKSGETEHAGAITYADLTEAGPNLPVIKRVENVDGKIVTTTIMQLQNLPSTPTTLQLQNVWVFDILVVAAMNDGNLFYFEKPMILGSKQNPLLVNKIGKVILPNPSTFKGKDIAVAADGATLEYYAVSST